MFEEQFEKDKVPFLFIEKNWLFFVFLVVNCVFFMWFLLVWYELYAHFWEFTMTWVREDGRNRCLVLNCMLFIWSFVCNLWFVCSFFLEFRMTRVWEDGRNSFLEVWILTLSEVTIFFCLFLYGIDDYIPLHKTILAWKCISCCTRFSYFQNFFCSFKFDFTWINESREGNFSSVSFFFPGLILLLVHEMHGKIINIEMTVLHQNVF